jgi:CRP-like cAMP-binding protein
MSSKILIIDDNKEVCENVNELLELAGYTTYTANNGKTGLEMAHKYKPNLILCDIMMPELDGYGVIRALQNIPGMVGIPFVFMSAKAEKSDFRTGMDLGADDYLTKPFNGDDLLKIVDARLRKNQLINATFKNNETELSELKDTGDSLEWMSSFCNNRTIKKVRKKDILFMEGESSNFLYFLKSGKMKIFKSNECGKEYIIDIYKEGDFLGYTALLSNSKHKESAMAIEDAEVALIPQHDFLKLLDSNKEMAISFVKLMSCNFSEAEEKLLKLAYDSARKRVAEAILFIYKKYQLDGMNELSFSLQRDNISALSGISPESVSRNLTDFREEGLIETTNGMIKILDLKKLEMLKN